MGEDGESTGVEILTGGGRGEGFTNFLLVGKTPNKESSSPDDVLFIITQYEGSDRLTFKIGKIGISIRYYSITAISKYNSY